MLRQIVSISLLMTACAAFIPTKANAVSLTFTPLGTVEKKPGDPMTFTISLNPMGSTIWFRRLEGFGYDGTELVYDFLSTDNLKERMIRDTLISDTTDVAMIAFRVLEGVRKDGMTDFFTATVVYDRYDPTLGTIVQETIENELETIDVVPVPEPLTIFGTAIGLGCGVLFKRKSSKKAVS